MRVFVISDMEGVSGIVKWKQVSGGEAMYEEGRRLYTEEINAAVRGAKRAGADEIVVTGDRAVCVEGQKLLGSGLTTVAVKQGLGRFSARQIPPVRVRRMIEEASAATLADLNAVEPYDAACLACNVAKGVRASCG